MARRLDRYPVGRLFAVATVRLEHAHAIAIAGQNPRLMPAEQRALQRQLVRAIARCADAAVAVAEVTSEE